MGEGLIRTKTVTTCMCDLKNIRRGRNDGI